MSKKEWRLMKKGADFNALGRRFGLDPLIIRLIVNRGYETEEEIDRFVNGCLRELNDPAMMGDMTLGADILAEKIEENAHIRVIGDYDIDGVMATYILVDAMKKSGANVDYVIPHRINDGYGINEDIVRQAMDDGVDTIVTCDNGISAFKQIELAESAGMTVIVTDHHDIPFNEAEGLKTYIIPPASAVIDPKISGCGYPFSGICGAVVAMKLMQVLYDVIGLGADVIVNRYLAMAAFATVGDVMQLVDENRIIVKYGLVALKNTDNIGMKALINACGISGDISAYHVGFVLGPCINASGRLDTALKSLELLFMEDEGDAMTAAMELRVLNEDRKGLTQQGLDLAVSVIESQGMQDRRVLVLYMPDLHESIAGLVAGKVREKYYRPVFVLTDSGDFIKGSGRSIPDYKMYDEMTKIKDVFTKYGGHDAAAGLSIERERLQEFTDRIEESCTLTEKELTEVIIIDADMPLGYANLDLVRQLSVLEPMGMGNTKPVFARANLEPVEYRIFGKSSNVGRYIVRENRKLYELTLFGDQSELSWAFDNKRPLTISYYPTINEYNNEERLQLVVKNFKES